MLASLELSFLLCFTQLMKGEEKGHLQLNAERSGGRKSHAKNAQVNISKYSSAMTPSTDVILEGDNCPFYLSKGFLVSIQVSLMFAHIFL